MRIRHDYLRELRLRFSKTQNEIAQEAGVDIRTYRKYENGEIGSLSERSLRASQFEFLRNLAAYYNLDGGPEELLAPDTAETVLRPAAVALPTTGRFTLTRYVHRQPEEARALRRLESAGAPVIIQAPERFGATRFVAYLLNQVDAASVIRVNLARLLSLAATSGRTLFLTLGEYMLQRVCADSALVEERTQQLRVLPATERGKLSWLMEQHILPLNPRTYLAVEHVDAIIGHAGQAEFFALLRSWAGASGCAPWNRLRLLLTLSTEPTLLEQGDHSAFLTLAEPIRLEELNRQQLYALAEMEETRRPEAIDKLTFWVGGNPYLARLALQAATERALALEQLLDDAELRREVFAHHLMYIRRALENQPNLLRILADILMSRAHHIRLEDYCFLYRKGLVVESPAGALRLRCRLYEEYVASLLALSSTPSQAASI